jgi:hypothetical protein
MAMVKLAELVPNLGRGQLDGRAIGRADAEACRRVQDVSPDPGIGAARGAPAGVAQRAARNRPEKPDRCHLTNGMDALGS